MGIRSGHIINISSDAAKTIFGALTVYNAAKAFVAVFSKGLRAECVGTGLRVTDIQPGDTATNLIMSNSDQEAVCFKLSHLNSVSPCCFFWLLAFLPLLFFCSCEFLSYFCFPFFTL
jgi:short-subunit dehydrogenase